MPQKDEGRDRLEVLQRSREFNPVIEFDVNSPHSSQRTSQFKMGSSRSNSDMPVLSTSVNVTNSLNLSQKVAVLNGRAAQPFHPATSPEEGGTFTQT